MSSYKFPVFSAIPGHFISLTPEEHSKFLQDFHREIRSSYDYSTADITGVVEVCREQTTSLRESFVSLFTVDRVLNCSEFGSVQAFLDYQFDVSDVKSVADIYGNLLKGMDQMIESLGLMASDNYGIFMIWYSSAKETFDKLSKRNTSTGEEHFMAIWTIENWFFPFFYNTFLHPDGPTNLPSYTSLNINSYHLYTYSKPANPYIQESKKYMDYNALESVTLNNWRLDHSKIVYEVYCEPHMNEFKNLFKDKVSTGNIRAYHFLKDFFDGIESNDFVTPTTLEKLKSDLVRTIENLKKKLQIADLQAPNENIEGEAIPKDQSATNEFARNIEEMLFFAFPIVALSLLFTIITVSIVKRKIKQRTTLY